MTEGTHLLIDGLSILLSIIIPLIVTSLAVGRWTGKVMALSERFQHLESQHDGVMKAIPTIETEVTEVKRRIDRIEGAESRVLYLERRLEQLEKHIES